MLDPPSSSFTWPDTNVHAISSSAICRRCVGGDSNDKWHLALGKGTGPILEILAVRRTPEGVELISLAIEP